MTNPVPAWATERHEQSGHHRRALGLPDVDHRHRSLGATRIRRCGRLLRGRQEASVLGHRLQLQCHRGKRLAAAGADRHGLSGGRPCLLGGAGRGARRDPSVGVHRPAVQGIHRSLRFHHRPGLLRGPVSRQRSCHSMGQRTDHFQHGGGLHRGAVDGGRQGLQRFPRHGLYHRCRGRHADRSVLYRVRRLQGRGLHGSGPGHPDVRGAARAADRGHRGRRRLVVNGGPVARH